MSVRKSVFGSRAEKAGFEALDHEWGEEYRLIPNLPFLMIFNPDSTIRDGHFFFKTSVDYVLCARDDDRPLVAVDFDGLGGGVSRNGTYVPVRVPKGDPWRKLKFDTKLQYAQRYGFPYHVVSYDEFESVGEGIKLNIVDAFIGAELSNIHFGKNIQGIVDEMESQDGESVQNMIFDSEFEMDLRYDGVTAKISKLMTEAMAISCGNAEMPPWHNHMDTQRQESYQVPPAPPAPTSFGEDSLESFEARVRGLQEAEIVGAIFTAQTCVGEVIAEMGVRNLGDYGSSFAISKKLAELLAWRKTVTLLKTKFQPAP